MAPSAPVPSGDDRAPTAAPPHQRTAVPPLARAAGLVALAAVAATAFRVAMTTSLEYIDEGQILYPSWRVATGAVPYRDFQHLYGPALFALNGAVLHVFGDSLLPIRWLLVALKTLTVLLAYALTRGVAARRAVLPVTAVLIAVWASPWWVFNTPYANHFALALVLAGLWLFVRCAERAPAAGALAAGLCFGLAATFKQTSGIFALLAFGMFLLLRARQPPGTAASERPPSAWAAILLACAVLVPVSAGALFTIYLAPRNTAWNLFVIGVPPFAVVFAALRTAVALRAAPAALRATIALLLCAGLGMALPLLVLVACYAAHGLLPELAFNMVAGLPQMVRWFTAFPVPDARVLVPAVAVAAALVAARRAAAAAAGARRAWPAGLVAGAVAIAAAVVFWRVWIAPLGIAAYARAGWWHGEMANLWSLLFVALGWGAAAVALRAGARAERDALRLVACQAAVAMLWLYPAADFWHVVMLLPAVVPVAAWGVQRYATRPAGGGAPAWLPAAALGALALALAAPSVDQLVAARRRPAPPIALERAPGISGPVPKFDEVAALIARLDSVAPAGTPMFVASGEQMLYVLAGRPSVVEAQEFALYLVVADIIEPADAHRLVDEQRLAAALAAAPVLVDAPQAPGAQRLRAMFPAVAPVLDDARRTRIDVGPYRILLAP